MELGNCGRRLCRWCGVNFLKGVQHLEQRRAHAREVLRLWATSATTLATFQRLQFFAGFVDLRRIGSACFLTHGLELRTCGRDLFDRRLQCQQVLIYLL